MTRGPCGKLCYHSRHAAKWHRRIFTRRMRAYWCNECLAWHLTTLVTMGVNGDRRLALERVRMGELAEA